MPVAEIGNLLIPLGTEKSRLIGSECEKLRYRKSRREFRKLRDTKTKPSFDIFYI
jgi:hypothetical protein